MTAELALLKEALSGYQPRTDLEAADLERIRSLLTAGDPWSRSTALHITVSALVVHPPTGRVLLRWHARQQAWLQVGGHADPGEVDPLAIALREAQEETGLDDLVPWPHPADGGPAAVLPKAVPPAAVRPGIVHLVVVPVSARGDEPAHEHADLRFVLATNCPDAIRPENPAAALRWMSIEDAYATTEPNVRETLNRVGHLLDVGSRRS